VEDILTVLELGCSVQLDKRQAVRLATYIRNLKREGELMRGLATAGADLAIANGSEGVALSFQRFLLARHGEVTPAYADDAKKVLQATPEQCLNQIKAEAGRAGFVAGYEKCWRESYGTKPNTDSVDEYADSYANRVQQGGAK
jgi:hypothetical protein